MSLVQVHHLEHWGRTVNARERLGFLLATLVRASLPLGSLTHLRFLHGVATQLSGWDGEVDCNGKNEYVPLGRSVWELGTGSREVGKVRSDFDKRTTDDLPEGWVRQETTYVAATLAKLQDAAGTATALAKESPVWKKVVIIDAVEICHWIHAIESVDIWVYEEVTGNVVNGIRSLANAWKHWSSITRPPIDSNLIVAARDPDVKRVQEALGAGTGLQIDADSPDEAVAFVHAAIEGMDEMRRGELSSRAIVISNREAAERFPKQSPQLLILKGEATSHALRFDSDGHQVVRVHGRAANSRQQGLRLVRQSRPDFSKALIQMGVPAERADIDARACGSSPSVWRVWNLVHEADASAFMPAWADAQHLDVVVPVVLTGGWSELSMRDLEVLKAISGMEYGLLRDRLIRINNLGEPLMDVVADTLVVAAPATAFAILARSIGRQVLDRYADQARKVFCNADESEPPDRELQSGSGGESRCSEWLRDGMAETLLRIAVLGAPLEEAGVLGSRSCQKYVDEFVRNLPGLSTNYRLLASLREQLPVLAEAAPVPFMEALEALLQGKSEELREIFAERSDFGGESHPYFLWALETVAWDPRWISRAVLVLGGLDEIDPGGNLGNRPAASIVDILLPWYPGTSATIQDKLATIDALLARYPPGGWKILLKLLPGKHTATSGTRRPEWKETRYAQGARIPRNEIGELYSGYVDRAILHASKNAERLAELIDSHSNLSPQHQQRLEAEIEIAISNTTSSLDLEQLWTALRKFISRHRQFPEASWSIGEVVLRRLDALMEKSKPKDSLVRHLWLFSEGLPELPKPVGGDSSNEQELERLREEAVKELWKSGTGERETMELVKRCSYPGIVAATLVGIEHRRDRLLDLFVDACNGTRPEEIFAMVLSAEAYKRLGDQWTQEVLVAAERCEDSIKSKVTALLSYPDSLELFSFMELLGQDVEKSYWSRHDGFVRSSDEKAIEFAVRKLVSNHRARDTIMMVAQEKSKTSPEELIRILDAAWSELVESKSAARGGSISFWIEKLLEKLRKNPDADKRAVASLEYRYLPMLVPGLEKKHLAIHDILAAEPSFFVEMLRDLYKPEHGERPSEDRSDAERQARAHLAWDLLRSWDAAPGVMPDGSLDVDRLTAWVSEARVLARESDRVTMADQQIGHILFHTPSDPGDGVWPHIGVRSLLESLRNEDVETGIAVEQFNSRGVTTRGPFDGGALERELADRWRNWSEKVGPRWPRTQALLARIAEEWLRDAIREDEDAAKQRLKYQ